jgi:hypothetical protein
MRLDHVSYACTSGELADVVQRIGADLGATFIDGGRHPAFGTRNFILPLAGGTYVEVVAALDHPAADRMPFGRAVRRRADDGGGWLGWVVAVDDITLIEARLGRSSIGGHRVRPDGFDLRWRQIGVLDLMEDPQLPFFIEWESTPDQHPSRGGGTIRLDRIEINGDSGVLTEWLAARDPFGDVKVDYVDAEDPGIVAITFSSPNGTIRID